MTIKWKESGFSLIEVLVSMLILAVGILGLYGFLLKGFSYKMSVEHRSYALLLAENMIEKIQINKDYALSTDNYVLSGDNPFSENCKESEYPGDCEQESCTLGELAAYDVAQWQFQLACVLPDGNGSITYTESSEGRLYTISVFFDSSIQSADIESISVSQQL